MSHRTASRGASSLPERARLAGGPRRSSRFSVGLVVLCFMPPTAFALAVWQYQRLQWKEGLIADLSTKLKKPAMHLPPVVNVEAIPEFAYRRVVVRGRFDHTREMLLGPKLQQGRLCYSLVTPLIRETAADESPGPDILVNRGYVDRDLAEQSRRPSSVADDSVTVVGMLRSQQSKSALASDNRPAAGQWIWPDIAAMAESAHTQPVLIDEVFVGNAGEIKERLASGVPIGRDATIELRNQHASYVMTWGSLSAFSSVLLWRLLRRRG